MKKNNILVIFALIAICLLLFFTQGNAEAQSAIDGNNLIFGQIIDAQNQPVSEAEISLHTENEIISDKDFLTQENGRFAVPYPQNNPEEIEIIIERSHFSELSISLSSEQITKLRTGDSVDTGTFTLERKITLGFWIAAAIFVIVLILVATGKLHTTLAALAGTAVIYAISYIGGAFNEELFIFNFDRSMQYIDWNVIFLVMGMMMVIAIIEETGIFQWMAFYAYKISGGKMWLLLPILMLITGVASAFLDNVTTMLLMTPITIQISIALGINPLALLIPEVMASNVVGVSTLVGTPTNILIGSFGDITFNDFLSNLTPGVVFSFLVLIFYSYFIYKKDLNKAHKPSDTLMEKLAERGKITEPKNLAKAGVVFAGMLILFVMGESIHLLPAVTALIGATALLLWIKPDIEHMISAVDWTTLVFFMALFIVVGGIQEVGLIAAIAEGIGNFVGTNLLLALIVVVWISAFLSMVIANIPFTAAMLPVIGYLTATIPGAESKVLFYCLSIGAAMGGNGSLIGASANMITAGIADAAGHKITYSYFLKKGLPAVILTVTVATIWLIIKFI